MKKKTAKKVEISEIPEVIEFVDARDTLEDFKKEHPEVFEQFAMLVEKYNTTLEAAEKACRSREVSSGPFDLYQFATKYDPERLFDVVGRETFLQLGGKLDTKTVYSLDSERFEVCVAQNKVAKDVVAEVRKEEPRFHKPKPVSAP